MDTNILVFMLLGENDQLSNDVDFIVKNAQGNLYTSSDSVIELLQLYRINKVSSRKYKTAFEMVQAIEEDFCIKILPFAKEHTLALSKSKFQKGITILFTIPSSLSP